MVLSIWGLFSWMGRATSSFARPRFSLDNDAEIRLRYNIYIRHDTPDRIAGSHPLAEVASVLTLSGKENFDSLPELTLRDRATELL